MPEIEGRHYGGGVLELVPSEIEELLKELEGENTQSTENISGSLENAILKKIK